ncbi:hypothetical protein BDD12DRAFT_806239 [Trichophaea hybrida]|nr:hypothetical protein BDD12DRAFT_806239 [Trichophaea hybrida]
MQLCSHLLLAGESALDTSIPPPIATIPPIPVLDGKTLQEEIMKLTPHKPEKLWTPSPELITLPFPALSCRVPSNIFSFSFGAVLHWGYMPRKKFSELLHQVEIQIKSSCRASEIWLHGTTGYGKSHLLAALVCFLIKSGHRVLYLPSCHPLVHAPMCYLQDAMELTWADSPDALQQIRALETLPEIISFFHGVEEEVIFVIDQMEALQQTGPTDAWCNIRSELHRALYKASYYHLRVFSTSANTQSYHTLNRSRSNLIKVSAFGGMTKEELGFWWERKLKEGLELGEHSKSKVEDMTGGVPWLLDRSIMGSSINLTSDVLRDVAVNVRETSNAVLNRKAQNPYEWEMYDSHLGFKIWIFLISVPRHCVNLNACIMGHAVPNRLRLDACVDHRYVFCEEAVVDGESVSVGRYICGAARNAMARILSEHTERPYSVLIPPKYLDL